MLLRALYLEDSSDDYTLVYREIARAGWEMDFERVETEQEFTTALKNKEWDIILADYNLPKYGGMNALHYVRSNGYEHPFILISGTIGEDAAVECMRAGANDYILKDNLRRLNLAIKREVEDSIIRRERHRAADEMVRLEGKLRQAQKMEAMGRLAGGIAHDFNNILTAILGHAEIASMQLEGHPVKGNLQQVIKASQRARDLVQQILAFSKQKPTERKVAFLDPVLQEAVKLLRVTIPASVEIVTHSDASNAAVLVDTSQVHQILMNLGTNASHAMKETGGCLTLTLELVKVGSDIVRQNPNLKEGPHVCLSISDTGCGMDPSTLDKVFEPFFTTKAPGEGTGLGLAVVHGIVQAHEGAITVESKIGHGTSFRMYFPVVAAKIQTAIEPPKETPEGHGEHVLIVDDEPLILALSETMLESLGYRVTSHSHPDTALKDFQTRSEEFGVVITDLNMPGMSGLQLVRELLDARADIPVVLMSGYVGDMEHEQATRLGFHSMLAKPFTLRALAEGVADALKPQPAKVQKRA